MPRDQKECQGENSSFHNDAQIYLCCKIMLNNMFSHEKEAEVTIFKPETTDAVSEKIKK